MAKNHTLFERNPSKTKASTSTSNNSINSGKLVKKSNKISIKKEIRTKLGLSKNHITILKKCKNENTAKELMEILGYTNLTKFRNRYLNILLDEYNESLKDVNKKIVQKKKKDEDGNVITTLKKKNDVLVKVPVMHKIVTKQQGYGFFKMSKPDKPNAKDQRYIFTGIFAKIDISK